MLGGESSPAVSTDPNVAPAGVKASLSSSLHLSPTPNPSLPAARSTGIHTGCLHPPSSQILRPVPLVTPGTRCVIIMSTRSLTGGGP